MCTTEGTPKAPEVGDNFHNNITKGTAGNN